MQRHYGHLILPLLLMLLKTSFHKQLMRAYLEYLIGHQILAAIFLTAPLREYRIGQHLLNVNFLPAGFSLALLARFSGFTEKGNVRYFQITGMHTRKKFF